MRLLALRFKNHRRRWLMRWLGWMATKVHTTVWTDHYRRPVTAAAAPYQLYVEVRCIKLTYEFGTSIGLRGCVKMTALVVIQHQLTAELSPTRQLHRYYGLDRDELLTLAQGDLPWLTTIPDGSPGRSRYHDRRAPGPID